ncbi:MAG: hypothetical protein R3325_03925 [Thermoanaerobaculia bacterium]|nr:hypothetical protein [Thermoanaerobaculia bacterium]
MRLAAWSPLLAALVAFALLATVRPGPERIWGDEGTFLAMTASLARDGDLIFDERDRDWARERLPGEGVTVILQRTGRGLAYSKPVIYPLLAAPLYRLVGEAALPLVNLLAMVLASALAWRALAGRGTTGRASLTLATFLGASVLLPYLAWRMSDGLQAAMVLAGLALAVGGGDGDGERRGRVAGAVAAGLLLGLTAAMRLPNAALAAGAAASNLATGRRHRALALAATALAAFALAGGLGRSLTGAANPYKALRTSFNAATGYPVGEEAEAAAERFQTQTNTSRIGWLPVAKAPRIAYSALYFLIGRHTGLLAYFPAALLFAGLALRRPDRRTTPLLLAAAAMVLFTLVWIPWNYFGGSTFLGNRYFLTVYPVLLFTLPGLPRPERLVPVWLLAAAALASAGISAARTQELDRDSQSHASAGIFRLLPYESTARRIDGGRDRYWAGDFVRFVDPWAELDEYEFRLESGRPGAELLVASTRPGGPFVLLVDTDHPSAELAFSDWGRDVTYLVPGGGPGPPVTVTLTPSPAWRRHRFWWTDAALYSARTLRLALRAPGGGGARVRYLGDGRLLTAGAAAELAQGALPATAVAGATDVVELTLRNTGELAWERDGLLPARLGYRLYGDGSERPREGPRSELPADVPPGAEVTVALPIRWPERPGRYRLVVDLVRDGAGWLADRGAGPVAEAAVRVRPSGG